MENYKWSQGIAESDAVRNKERTVVKNIFISTMRGEGFTEIGLPTLDYSEKYILNNDYYTAQNHFKSVAPNGEVLSVADDLIAGLISFSRTEMETKGRLCTAGEEYSFLAQNNGRTKKFGMAGIIYGESGAADEADAIAAGVRYAEAIGVKNPAVTVSNTGIFLGVLNLFAKREESLERLKKIVSGNIENDVDYAVAQSITPMKNAEGGAGIIKELSAKLDNKTSISALLDVFETIGVLEAYNIADRVTVKPGYLGQKRYDNGIVFEIKDEKGRTIVYGGRCDCQKGGDDVKCLYVYANEEESVSAADDNGITENEKSRFITVAVAEGTTALVKAYKVRNDFAKENLIPKVVYNVTRQDAYAMMGENDGGMVIYIDEEGNITYS